MRNGVRLVFCTTPISVKSARTVYISSFVNVLPLLHFKHNGKYITFRIVELWCAAVAPIHIFLYQIIVRKINSNISIVSVRHWTQFWELLFPVNFYLCPL